MICKVCGANLPETAAFCNSCGARVIRQEASTSPIQANIKEKEGLPMEPPALGQAPPQTNLQSLSNSPQQAYEKPGDVSNNGNPIPPFYSTPYSPMSGPQAKSDTRRNAPPTMPVNASVNTNRSGIPNYGPSNGTAKEEDKKSVPLNLVSWFVPLAGIILYFVNRDDKPIRSKSNIKCALISLIVNVLLAVVGTFIIIGGTFAAISAVDGWEESSESDYSYETYVDDGSLYGNEDVVSAADMR